MKIWFLLKTKKLINLGLVNFIIFCSFFILFWKIPGNFKLKDSVELSKKFNPISFSAKLGQNLLKIWFGIKPKLHESNKNFSFSFVWISLFKGLSI